MPQKAGVEVLGFYVHNIHKTHREVMTHGSVDGIGAGRIKSKTKPKER
jgi:hypothetical protein